MVGLLIKLQGGFILRVIDIDFSSGHWPQQGVHWHTQLHIKALDVLKDLVIIDNNGAHLGVFSLIKLNLRNIKKLLNVLD